MASGHEALGDGDNWSVGVKQRWRRDGRRPYRAKVEHPFLWVKRRFGYAKVRYRGLAKNTQRLALLLGLTNLITAERHLAAS